MSRVTIGATLEGKDVHLDVDRLVESRMLIQANSGAGKSWALRRLLEQTHGKVQHLVLDVEGEFHTLRERFDYVLAARSGGDTLAAPHTAALLARRLLELGVSAILDLYELPAHERVRFVRLFLEALIDAPKTLWHPALVVVDEAHLFCPEGEKAESAAAVKDLMTRGRKRGFAGVLATQRLAKLHKDAAAEANVKLLGRATLDTDMKRAGAELGFARADLPRFRSLERGHFFAFGPGLSDQVIEVVVGEVTTTHPKAGQRSTPVPPAREKVRKVLAQLADLPKEAEAEAKTAGELRQQVTQLKRELAAKPQPAAAPAPKVQVVEKHVLKDGHLKRLEALTDRWAKGNDALAQVAGEIAAALRNGHGKSLTSAATSPLEARWSQGTTRTTGLAVRMPPTPSRVVAAEHAEGITAPQQRILDALRWAEVAGMDDLDRPRVGFFAKASPRSSAFKNNLGALRGRAVIEYLPSGTVRLTATGRALAAEPEAPATTEELQSMVLAGLTDPQQRILRALIGVFPQALVRVALADLAQASATSSAFKNNLGFLRGLGLAEYRAEGVAATGRLFVGAGASP